MRQRIVPSRPATGSDVTYSAWSGKRDHIARSSVTSWRALKRFVSFSPEPFFITYAPRGMPMLGEELLAVASTPFDHDPGAPFASAPRVFRSCSATKLFEVLFSRRTISASVLRLRDVHELRAGEGPVPVRIAPVTFTPRSARSFASV